MLHKRHSTDFETHILEGQFVDVYELETGGWAACLTSPEGVAGAGLTKGDTKESVLQAAQDILKRTRATKA